MRIDLLEFQKLHRKTQSELGHGVDPVTVLYALEHNTLDNLYLTKRFG